MDSSFINYVHAYEASLGMDRAGGGKKRETDWGQELEAESPKELGIINSNINLHDEYAFVKVEGRTYLQVDL